MKGVGFLPLYPSQEAGQDIVGIQAISQDDTLPLDIESDLRVAVHSELIWGWGGGWGPMEGASA